MIKMAIAQFIHPESMSVVRKIIWDEITSILYSYAFHAS